MKKDHTLIALGIWIVILPFLGFPGSWKTILFVLSGLGVALLTILWRHELMHPDASVGRGNHDVYVENGASSQKAHARHLNIGSEETSKHGETQINS